MGLEIAGVSNMFVLNDGRALHVIEKLIVFLGSIFEAVASERDDKFKALG